ncbi:MAG: polyphosphate kinase 1, partial [Flavitalea sp.]
MNLKKDITEDRYFNRDLSWLSFNERVLMEAENKETPLMERLKFLSIYSSNLDEFYRVRMPAILAMGKIKEQDQTLPAQINQVIAAQQERFGSTLRESVIPSLGQNNIEFIYGSEIPAIISKAVNDIFFTKIAGHLQLISVSKKSDFLPENNKLFFAVNYPGSKQLFVVNIPSDSISRFYNIEANGRLYVVMLDDIIRIHLHLLFSKTTSINAYAFKITRDAELHLTDEVAGSLTSRMEKQLAKRDFGLATRLLYDASMPAQTLSALIKAFDLQNATIVKGGRYHNLKDLINFPLTDKKFLYQPLPAVSLNISEQSLFAQLDKQDLMLHTPYHNYDLVLRFFNEAAIDPSVERIYITLYRIAQDSGIAQALITAAKNGKRVIVMVELKARFDEANNIRWSKKMKEAGIELHYSSTKLKVHAKIALVRKRVKTKIKSYGLLSTGNFNETTARFYTDQILFTADQNLLKEIQTVFTILTSKKNPLDLPSKNFKHLIVAPFNIRDRFFELIDREIANCRKGIKAGITVKLNNLEEETLIDKLYEASNAGVAVNMIVRSICRLVPGVPNRSENITVTRIVDRYLEHSRIFVFENGGEAEIFCGSADWMNRNIYHRIEVCFPVTDLKIKSDLKTILQLQLSDTEQAVEITKEDFNSFAKKMTGSKIRSQNS